MEKTFVKPVIDQTATGKKIKQIRMEQGFSVRDIQNIFGVDYPQAVYAWEQGKNVPSIDNLLVLGQLFGVNVDELIVTRQVEVLLEAEMKKSA